MKEGFLYFLMGCIVIVALMFTLFVRAMLNSIKCANDEGDEVFLWIVLGVATLIAMISESALLTVIIDALNIKR